MTVWTRSLLAAVISGASGGVVNAFACMGIAPNVFNFHGGMNHLLALAAISATFSGILGLAMYLKSSPLPGITAAIRRV